MTYRKSEVASFCKVKEIYGIFSNMHNGCPISINGVTIGSSEALYQAMRYPDYPEIQKEILEATTAYASKIISKKYLDKTRNDWLTIRVNIMEWVLKMKYLQNIGFANKLQETGNLPIVEISRFDTFWGCNKEGDILTGDNVLGRTLVNVREYFRDESTDSYEYGISNQYLFGKPIIGNHISHSYFKSIDTAYDFYLSKTDGTVRSRLLGIRKSMYSGNDSVDIWYTKIKELELSGDSIQILDNLYGNIVKHT